MTKKLKVWGWAKLLDNDTVARLGLPQQTHNQYRCIVAAASKRRAAELVGSSMYEFNGWWSQTGNQTELAVATEEGVWVAPRQGRESVDVYKRLEVGK